MCKIVQKYLSEKSDYRIAEIAKELFEYENLSSERPGGLIEPIIKMSTQGVDNAYYDILREAARRFSENYGY